MHINRYLQYSCSRPPIHGGRGEGGEKISERDKTEKKLQQSSQKLQGRFGFSLPTLISPIDSKACRQQMGVFTKNLGQYYSTIIQSEIY